MCSCTPHTLADNINDNSSNIPPGLNALYSTCNKIYPNQTNPLQICALVKYWLGGPDPLDYISIYSNNGDSNRNIPPHWHYIGFGLSDLHGDERVHKYSDADLPSGFGYELTFRLAKSENETQCPTWPAKMMQSLALYVFTSGNTLCAGDHVSRRYAMGDSDKIKHILLTQDPQFSTVHTPCGTVEFIQIVGISEEELQAAQQWNGFGILNIMKTLPGMGGEWLVTNIKRQKSIFDIDSTIRETVERGIDAEGSNLGGVSCLCSWTDRYMSRKELNKVEKEFMQQSPDDISSEEKLLSSVEQPCVRSLQKPVKDFPTLYRNAIIEDENNSIDNDEKLITHRKVVLSTLHIVLNREAGILLPLVVRGRLKHGRHFTYNTITRETAITFVPWNVEGPNVFVDVFNPFVAFGPWVQIYIPEDFLLEMEASVNTLKEMQDHMPKTFYWEDRNLAITVVPDNK